MYRRYNMEYFRRQNYYFGRSGRDWLIFGVKKLIFNFKFPIVTGVPSNSF